MSSVILILGAISVILAVTMLVTRNPITSALCLLGVLVMTAAIYGLIGEHLIATIQLVVYAGAIMVLFIFSIMLLNLNSEENEIRQFSPRFLGAVALGMAFLGFVIYSINKHFAHHRGEITQGQFTPEKIEALGGNAKVLAHSLFSQFYVSFEVISLALLVAVVGAVVLAKRKFD